MRAFVCILFGIVCLSLLNTQAAAQGGWRQWEIHFVDGTSLQASPLQMRNDRRFTRSMDPKEAGFQRSEIDYFAIKTEKQLPPAPTGKIKQDLVVMLDGSRTLGPVAFRELKFSEGKIVQNRKVLSLENVAYIKFAHLKPKITKKEPS